MTTLARLARRSHALRVPAIAAGALTALAAVFACSDYFGSGPDPAADGRVDGGAAGSGGGLGGCRPLDVFDPASVIKSSDQRSAACPKLAACVRASCDQEMQACFGGDYATQRDFMGTVCESVVTCVTTSDCDPLQSIGWTSCASESCTTCLRGIATCEDAHCSGLCSP